MTSFVIDASVAVKWFLQEEDTEKALLALQPANNLSAPEFLWVEFANVLRTNIRSKRLSSDDALKIWRHFVRVPILFSMDGDYAETAFQLALETDNTVYDCLYLALATKSKHPLVTADRKFYNSLQKTPYSKNTLWVGNLS